MGKEHQKLSDNHSGEQALADPVIPEGKLKEIYRNTIAQHENHIRDLRLKMEPLKKSNGMHVKKLERLKETLSAFRSAPMPFIDASTILLPAASVKPLRKSKKAQIDATTA